MSTKYCSRLHRAIKGAMSQREYPNSRHGTMALKKNTPVLHLRMIPGTCTRVALFSEYTRRAYMYVIQEGWYAIHPTGTVVKRAVLHVHEQLVVCHTARLQLLV